MQRLVYAARTHGLRSHHDFSFVPEYSQVTHRNSVLFVYINTLHSMCTLEWRRCCVISTGARYMLLQAWCGAFSANLFALAGNTYFWLSRVLLKSTQRQTGGSSPRIFRKRLSAKAKRLAQTAFSKYVRATYTSLLHNKYTVLTVDAESDRYAAN